jgi:hypothetical protein
MPSNKQISPGEQAKRKNAIRQTVAIMGHQDMAPSSEMLTDMEFHAAGLLTDKEFLSRCDARVATIVKTGTEKYLNSL